MNRLSLIISEFMGTTGRLSGMTGQILQDRLELVALELREAKIRFIQALLLVCVGAVFSLLGLLLLVQAGVSVLAPEWSLPPCADIWSESPWPLTRAWPN
jgi:uncharacterized membrane protein YqjE